MVVLNSRPCLWLRVEMSQYINRESNCIEHLEQLFIVKGNTSLTPDEGSSHTHDLSVGVTYLTDEFGGINMICSVQLCPFIS